MAHNCLTVATFQGVKVQVETDLYSTVNNNYMQCLTQDLGDYGRWTTTHATVWSMHGEHCICIGRLFMGFESK